MPSQRASTTFAPAAKRIILVVDDNAGIRSMLRTLFESDGFAVREAVSEAQVLQQLTRGGISLITLDLALAGEDGLAIARAVRARSDVPVIMITAKGDEIDRVVGLEIGADDYLPKPFNVREVLARVRAVLRRTERTTDATAGRNCFRFADFELRMAERALVLGDGTPLSLTAREFLMLEAFVRRPAHVLTRTQLLDLVGGEDGEALERSVDTLVGRLRRKIETDPAHPCLIRTVRGGGYVFSATVSVS